MFKCASKWPVKLAVSRQTGATRLAGNVLIIVVALKRSLQCGFVVLGAVQ